MTFSIEEFKAQLEFGGARQTQFHVQFINPADSVADIKVPVMCKAASLPASTLGTIQVPFFGRMTKLAGDRTFEAWSVTVINDEDFLIRNALETWSNRINSLEGNLRNFGSASPLAYKSNAIVTQYGKRGNMLRQYTFHGIYPESVSSIQLDWSATDQIEEFTCNFTYDWFDVTGGTTGNGGGN